MAKVSIEVVSAVDDALKDMKALDSSLGNLDATSKTTRLSLTDLKSGIDLASQALRVGQEVVKAVIDPTVEYAKQVRDLSRTIGASAEETSKLIQAADDVKIEVTVLESALESAIRRGVKPTIDGIGELADQYNAIQDPIDRTKFLIDTFGRSGADLAPLMELGAEGIRELGEEAETLGLVMDEKGIQAARDYEIAMDGLSDAVTGLKYQLGQPLITAITDVADETTNAINVHQLLKEAIDAEAITTAELAEVQKLVYTGEMAAAIDLLQDKLNDYKATVAEVDPFVQNLRASQDDLTTATGNTDRATEAYTARLQGLADHYAAVDEKTNLAVESMKAYSAQLLFNQVAAGLDADAQLVLASHLGLVDEKTLTLLTTVPKLTEQFDTNGDGAVGAGEDVQGYLRALLDLDSQLSRLDGKHTTSKHTHINETVTTAVDAGSTSGGIGGDAAAPRQFGGPVAAGMPYLVGERGPELFVPGHSGAIVPNNVVAQLTGADELASAVQQMVAYQQQEMVFRRELLMRLDEAGRDDLLQRIKLTTMLGL